MSAKLNTNPHRDRRGRATRRRGFTLIEAALTTVIIGTGVVAMLQLLAAGTIGNVEAAQSTMAVNLARNVREMTVRMSYADVRALNGRSYVPPIDSGGENIGGFDGWSQRVVVQPVSIDRLITNTVEADPEAVRITVEIVYNGEAVGEVQWYRFRPGSS
jgi:type II secretory pathway pseudopilin PulG